MKKKCKLIILLLATVVMATEADAQKVPTWKIADLKAVIDTSQSPTILNFWATFCKPCIAEMPHFETLSKAYQAKGVRLIFVSLDLKESYPAEVENFMRSRNLSSPVVYLNESNADLFVPVVDSSWSGAIPASLFLNKKAGYRSFWEEPLSQEKLDAEIRKMLGLPAN